MEEAKEWQLSCGEMKEGRKEEKNEREGEMRE
jgi:hypothetical protein